MYSQEKREFHTNFDTCFIEPTGTADVITVAMLTTRKSTREICITLGMNEKAATVAIRAARCTTSCRKLYNIPIAFLLNTRISLQLFCFVLPL